MDKTVLDALRRHPKYGALLSQQRADEDEQRRAALEFDRRQRSLLREYHDKRFVVSAAFFSAALEELKKSFVLGEEGGMLAFFRPKGDILYCNAFYGTDWIEKNDYGLRSPCNIWWSKKDSPEDSNVRTTFGWRIQRLQSLVDGRPNDELLLLCHTHFKRAEPSLHDLSRITSAIIVSFAATSSALERLVHSCRDHHPLYETVQKMPKRPSRMSDAEWQEVTDAFTRGRLKRCVHNKIPLRVWNRIVSECKPTARLFYKDRKNNTKRIPLYLEGAELL